MGRLTEYFGGLQNRYAKSETSAGKGATIKIPDLPRALQRITDLFGPKIAQQVYKKGVMAGGKIMLDAARAKAAWRPPARKKRGQPGEYGRTGALPKSLKIKYRTNSSKNYSYIVIGVARDKGVTTRRGRQTVVEDPSKTVHLMEKGYTAVARVAGVRGRQGVDVLRSIRHLAKLLKISRRRLSLRSVSETGFDSTFASYLQESEAKRASRYFAYYRGARRTVVPGRHFMRDSARESQARAILAAKEAMEADFARLLKEKGASP